MKAYKIQIIIILLAVSTRGTAQADLQNTGLMFISTGSDVYVNGNVTNASTAALTNNGNLYVTRNLTNAQPSVAIGAGTLRLTGTVQQFIAGTQPFRTLNLNTDNAAGFILYNDLSVSGAHTFTNGIVASSATPNYIIYESGSSYTGAADSRHVSGWVKKIGNTGFVFPVGTGSAIRPIELTNLVSNSEFNVHHHLSTPNTNSLQSPLLQLDPYEYWEINRVSGGNAQVAMNWDKPRVDFPQYELTSIRSAYFTGGQWTNVGGSATGNVPTTGNITSNAMSAFGIFTMGSISAVLPVSFLGISAVRKNNIVLIEWQSADQVNVERYEVERSVDGRHFVNAGSVDATAATGVIEYNYADQTLYAGQLWYRVKSIDHDGKQKVSNIVTVTGTLSGHERFTVINPARTNLSVISNGMQPGLYVYRVRNNGGQTMQTGRLNITGNGRFAVDLKNTIEPGVYILTISRGAFMQNEKIWITK